MADEATVRKLKQVFVRFAAEEILRRNINKADELSPKIGNHLFLGHEKFIADTFAKREKEIVELHEVKPD